MSKHPLAATATLLVLATSSFLTSCTTSKIMVQTNPADAMIWIDGRQTVRSTAGAAIQARPSYYGTTTIHCRQPSPMRAEELLDQHRQVERNEPFSPWLFPFDFLLEAVTLPFDSDRYQQSIDIKLQARPTPVRGIRPRNLSIIRERARQAVLAR